MMSTIDPERFGLAIRRIRKIRNLSLQELAKRMDVSEAFLSMVENGKRNLSRPQMNALVKALDVAEWYLTVLGSPPQKKDPELDKIRENLAEVIFEHLGRNEGKRW